MHRQHEHTKNGFEIEWKKMDENRQPFEKERNSWKTNAKTRSLINFFSSQHHFHERSVEIVTSPTMSRHSDDNTPIVSGDSFREPNKSKRTTKRIEDGYRLCGDLITLVQERAEIEEVYAKSLKKWSKKWDDIIEKGQGYGTTKAACKAVLMDADKLGDLHQKGRYYLYNDVIQQIRTGQESLYWECSDRKSTEYFSNMVQKPWIKLLKKVNKAKKDYHMACKVNESEANHKCNAAGDSSSSPD